MASDSSLSRRDAAELQDEPEAAPPPGGGSTRNNLRRRMAALLKDVRDRLTPMDRWAVTLLVLLPIVINVPWAIAGHPLLAGDNLTQNYPLRVLAGELLRHGHLPLWNPDIWSGVPLLAGWNAGAMYPGTWLFAVLPGVAAWEVNLVSVGVIAGLGAYLLMRRLGCASLSSLLGALVFTYTGFMSGQSLHIGLVEGTAFLPLMLLAVDWMARPEVRRTADLAWPVVLLGLASGLTVLAGDPRAISNDAIAVAVFVVACGIRAARKGRGDGTDALGASDGFSPLPRRRRLYLLLAGLLAAAALGAAASAVQWLPGLAFVQHSQRAGSSYVYFTGGSLGYNDLSYLLVPFVYGGNGNFNLPGFAGSYNMPELTYGVGLLPLVALLVLSYRALRRRAKNVGAWVAMFLVGVLLATGGNTPLGHLLVHVPLYGGERLQNRNALISDMALAVLLAMFVDTFPRVVQGRERAVRAAEEPGGVPSGGVPSAPWRAEGSREPGGRPLPLAERLLGLVPLVLAVALVTAMLAVPVAAERLVSPTGTVVPSLPDRMSPYYAVVVCLALATALLLWKKTWRRIAARSFAAVIVGVDVLVFILMATYQPAATSVLDSQNASAAQLASISANPPGRTAIFNPQETALPEPDRRLFDDLGLDDLILLHHMWSVQGYGSAVSDQYEAATGAHEVMNLRPSQIPTRLFDVLDLRTMETLPSYLGSVESSSLSAALPKGPPQTPGSSAIDQEYGNVIDFSPYPPTGPFTVPPGGAANFTLPGPVVVDSVVVRLEQRYGSLPTRLTGTFRLRSGAHVVTGSSVRGSTVTLEVPSTELHAGGGAVQLALSAAGTSKKPPVIGAVAVHVLPQQAPDLSTATAPSHAEWFALDGLLQGLLSPSRWHFAARVGPVLVFDNAAAFGPAWLEAPGATSPEAPHVAGSVTEKPVAEWQSPRETVSASRPVLLVRSETYAAGWTVSISPAGSASSSRNVSLPVKQVGLVQGVEIPPGRWVVTWHYKSARAELGLAAGAAALIAAGALVFAGARWRRRTPAAPGGGSLPHALRDLDRDRAAMV